jgi:hypothetical protein
MDLQQQLDLSTRLFQRGFTRGYMRGYQTALVETLESVLDAERDLDGPGFEQWKREARDVIACEREHHL